MQQLNLNGKTKTEQAIEFIQKHEPPEGYFVGQSGGKDSCVIENLVKESGVKYQSYYERTGIDPPQVVKHIKKNYPSTIFLKPKASFYKLIETKGYPTKFRKWCCEAIKHSLADHIPLNHRIFGIRSEESSARAKYGFINSGVRKKEHVAYLPIFQWREWEVWEYIDSKKLPYCSLYDEGFSRLGCVVCPSICSHDRKKLDFHKKRWPKIYKSFERSMRKLYNSEHKPSVIEMRKTLTFDEFLDNWYRGK